MDSDVRAFIGILALGFFALGVNDVFVGRALVEATNAVYPQMAYNAIREWFLASSILTILAIFGAVTTLVDAINEQRAHVIAR